jgi:16S rRNA G966 N2-methylase RsmD
VSFEPNFLYYGDNLDVLRRHVGDESVDLVYLDPPFKSTEASQKLLETVRVSKAGSANTVYAS